MSKYFETFQTIDYEFSPGKTKKALDIIRRFNVPSFVYDADTHAIVNQREGQTPESIAFDDYDDIDKYWSFLLFNKVIDPFEEWYLPERFIEEKLDKMYPGISLFVTLNQVTNLNTSTVNTKGSNAGYRIGDLIKIYKNNDTLLGEGTLYDYDRTTGHMKIKDVETFDLSAGDYILDENQNKKMYIARKFDQVKLSLYNFVDDSGNIISPYYDIGSSNKVIDLYVHGDADTLLTYEINIITIRDDQLTKNQNLSSIYYPSPSVLNEIETAVVNFNKR